MENALIYAQNKKSVHLDQFKDFLSIPSVSTNPIYQQDVDRAADWIVAEATRIGLKNAKKMPTAGHPIVYAEWLDAGPGKPTILFYAHYDVQPPDPLDLWETPPFEPTEREGRLYSRGTVDDKPGVFITLKAFEAYFQTAGRLPINVKVLFEGEEEMGSPSIEPFLNEYGEQFRADAILVNDGSHWSTRPTTPLGSRGIIGGEVVVRGPARDLHSGSFGGWVENPLHVVARIIASIHDGEGRIAIPHYYDDVEPLTEENAIAQEAAENPEFMDDLLNEAKVKKPYWGEGVAPLGVRMWGLPTFDVNGIKGGYQEVGIKTIIPAEASFKFTSRLAPNQDPQHAIELVRGHLMSFVSTNTQVQIMFEPFGAWPVKSTLKGSIAQAVRDALQVAWGKAPLLYPEGGTVPLLGIFDRKLKMPLIDMAYVTGEYGHSPNENLLIKSFYIGIESAIRFIGNLGASTY